MKSILLLLTVLLASCSSFSTLPQEITFYERESFDEVKKGSSFVITEKEEIRKIQMGVSRARKEAGVVNIIDPEFSFKVGEDSYFLWLDSGVIMDQADTHVIYTMKEKDHTYFKEIINEGSSAQ